MMKNAFYLMLKTLFFVRYLNFRPDFFGHVGKRLNKKVKIISKFLTSQTGKTNNHNIHICPLSQTVKATRQ